MTPRSHSIAHWTTFLGALIALVPAAWGVDQTFDLSFAPPSRQPIYYRNEVIDIVGRFTGGDKSGVVTEKTTLQALQTLAMEFEKVDRETLAVRTRITDFKVTVNGKEANFQPEKTVAVKRIDVKGYRKKPGKSAADYDKFDVILPLDPVKVGGDWTYTAPPTSDLPVYLVTRYTLKGFRKVGSADCAVIAAESKAEGVALERQLHVVVHATGLIEFAHREGYLVSSDFKVKLSTTPTKSKGSKEGKVVKITRSTMKLLRLGD